MKKPSYILKNYWNMHKLSIVIPCYNEQATLEKCVERVLAIQDDHLDLELIIVDDASQDNSVEIARALEQKHSRVSVFQHQVNQGKGAALRTGFARATGDFNAGNVFCALAG